MGANGAKHRRGDANTDNGRSFAHSHVFVSTTTATTNHPSPDRAERTPAPATWRRRVTFDGNRRRLPQLSAQLQSFSHRWRALAHSNLQVTRPLSSFLKFSSQPSRQSDALRLHSALHDGAASGPAAGAVEGARIQSPHSAPMRGTHARRRERGARDRFCCGTGIVFTRPPGRSRA
jgi:hypothetical protein